MRGEILARSKAEGIHTAIETAANCPWRDLEDLLPFTDLVMMDIKHMDPARHRAVTGVSNERILKNARRLAGYGAHVLFRVPVIPTVNDTPAEIQAIAAFVRDLPGEHGALDLLPFHRLAGDKFRSLGLEDRSAQLTPLTKEQMAALAEAARACGVNVTNR